MGTDVRLPAPSVPDSIYLIIAAAFFGFLALAALLLVPVYRFLTREEHASRDWTDDAIAKRQRRDAPPSMGDGASSEPPKPPARGARDAGR